MAFFPKELALLTQGELFKIWHYRLPASQTVAELTATGFFNAAANIMHEGDIVVYSRADGTLGGMSLVNEAAAGVVDLTNPTAFFVSTLEGSTTLRADRNALAMMTYANGFTLWYYRTEDEVLETEKDGYWNTCSSLVKPGDIIFGRYTASGSPRWGMALVLTNDGQTVEVGETSTFF